MDSVLHPALAMEHVPVFQTELNFRLHLECPQKWGLMLLYSQNRMW